MPFGPANRCSPTRGPPTKSCRRRERSKVSSSRRAARSCARWSGFLRGEGINVRTVADAEGAFEEALLHPPDIVLIDDRVPPSGGIDLVHRLKANVRTHFVPTILCTLNDLRRERVRALAAGVDAVFAPSTDVEETAGARCGRCCARARCTGASTACSAPSAARSSIAASGCRISCTTSRGRSARSPPTSSTWPGSRPTPATRGAASSTPASRTRAASSSRSRPSVRTVLDYDRFETGQLVPREDRFRLGEAAAEPIETLRRLAAMAERSLSRERRRRRTASARCTAIAIWSRARS